jgi:glycosyltransferase involved in cell wall biosynthesis
LSRQLASIVLPIYNQADHIETVLRDYVSSLARLDFAYELLPVINGPRRDESLAICQALQARFPVIRTLCIEQGGWGRAVRAGLASARGDLLCYANSARTTGRDLLLVLLYASIHPEVVVKANRRIRENWTRRLGSLLYNLECRALFDLPYWDINGTPKAFHRHLTRLVNLTRDDDLIDLEFNVICRQEGYPVIETPIFSSTRHSGGSTTDLRAAFRLYRGALKLRDQMNAP